MSDKFRASYLPDFYKDVQSVSAWSEEHFGVVAAVRYRLLISQALRDLLEQPTRPGAKSRPDLAPHAYVYHLAFSRERVVGARVKAPRHFVLYRHRDNTVEFAWLLHDSRDLARHAPAAFEDE